MGAQEAVDLYWEVVGSGRVDYVSHLATAVTNLSIDLRVAGRRTEAMSAVQEALALRRELVAQDRELYLPDFARSLDALATVLWVSGQGDEAVTTAQEAVDLRRELVATDRELHLVALATALVKLGHHLVRAGRGPEAVAATQEAVDLRRERVGPGGAALVPAGRRVQLAVTLTSLAIRLHEEGRQAEAVSAAREAAEIYGVLAIADPSTYEHKLNRAQRVAQQMVVRDTN
ncbi:tetratricopeptide repeat protein [Dermatophilaceae bacterium Soc4.6]